MKKNWEVTPLSNLCKVFTDGDWVESKDQSPEGIRLVQTGNIGEGIFKNRSDKARYISSATFDRLRCTEIVQGDCLVSRLPDPVGRACVLPATGERMITAVDCTIIRFKQEILISQYFVYYSQSPEYLQAVASECTGTTRNRISRNNLGLIPVPVPPLPEQQRIVALLDEAFAGLATAKANAERNLQNAREVFEGHLEAVFAHCPDRWISRPLADCLELITYGFTNPMPTTPSGPFMITAKNVVGGRIDYASTRHTSQEAFETLLTDKSRPRIGDVLLTKDGTLGRVAVVDKRGTCINQSVALLRVNHRMIPHFMCFLLSSRGYQKQMIDDAGGTTIKHIYITRVDKMPIVFPDSAEEQAKIVCELNALAAECKRLEQVYERKLTALEELKKSLLQQAFNGEL
jgi:type I restriction enzyme, S subunit